jgi:chromosome segregation ATPase
VREELGAQARRAQEAGEKRRADKAAVRERLDALEASLADTSAVSAAVEPLQARLDELEQRLSNLAATQSAERSAAANALDQRLGQLESSLTEHAAGRDADRRAELDALRSDLVARVEQVAASTADRGELEALRQRLEQELTEQLDRQGQEDAAARVTGQAIRDGLAELGRRLTASEQAYFESGRSLRRSIEGLGLAITDADWHLGSDSPAAEAAGEESYVAFVPAGEGYRLVECDGPAPYLGQIIELDGFDDVMLRVSRLGRSPLPFDGRPCAYLERLSA